MPLYCTLINLELANVHTYYNPNDTRKNKNKYTVILKISFDGSIRVAEGSNDRQAYTWKASGLHKRIVRGKKEYL